jgi:hypothetical protein
VANVGECLTIAAQITLGDRDNWYRLFTQAQGAGGHCEGMAPIVFWTAAFDWLNSKRA